MRDVQPRGCGSRAHASSLAATRGDERPPSPEIDDVSGALTAAIASVARVRRDQRRPPSPRRRTPRPSRRRPAAPASAGRARRSAGSASSSSNTPATQAGDVLADAVADARRPAPRPTPATARPARTRARTAPAACSRFVEQRRASVAPRARRAAAASSYAAQQPRRTRSSAARNDRLGVDTARGPCPAYCEPWPVNRNATPGARPARPARRPRRPRRRRWPRRASCAAPVGRRSSPATREPVRKLRAAGVGRVTRRRPAACRGCAVRCARVPCRQLAGSAARRLRRQRQHVRAARSAGTAARRGRRLLDDDVRVRAAEAERADAGERAAARRAATAVGRGRDVERQCRPAGSAGSACSKCRCGGICSCCSASTTLIRPAMPAAASRWPMLVLTEPTTQRLVGRAALAQHRAERLDLDRIAERRAGAVRLDVARRRRARRRRWRAPARITACCAGPFGHGEPAAAAVLVDRRAADHGEHAIAVGAARRTAA